MRQPKEIDCACGRHLVLDDSWYNKCSCGRGYNAFGQKLAPPSQWGEETGEAFDSEGRYLGGGEDT